MKIKTDLMTQKEFITKLTDLAKKGNCRLRIIWYQDETKTTIDDIKEFPLTKEELVAKGTKFYAYMHRDVISGFKSGAQFELLVEDWD